MAIYFLLLLLLLLLPLTIAQNNPLDHMCGGGNYTANSTFQSNLQLLLPSLASVNSSFATHTQGASTDKAYGLVLCRGDVHPDDCKSCIKSAAADINTLCTNSKQAIVWYDPCQLRYSDVRFFGSVDGNIVIMFNSDNQTDPGTFIAAEKELMGKVAARAANSSSQFFATGMITYRNNMSAIYGLTQCTRDLSADKCSQCLLQNLNIYWSSGYTVQKGGRILGYSCNFRYEVYAFFAGDPTISLSSPAPAPAPATVASTPPPTALSPPPVLTGGEESQHGKGKKHIGKVLAIAIPSSLALALTSALCFFLWRRKSSKKNVLGDGVMNIEDISSAESLLYDLSILKAATNNFSDANKLGEGGFGAVYKGTLAGEEVAVKRLSASSKQGLEELKNELLLVAKLQHKNLVRLRGVCLEGEEKLLIYEYMPNRSLDTFLFDSDNRGQLDWERRFNIIGGIARGLRYLHEESHLVVIHRDLKASNVLLDTDMNPKISDFGLARLFVVDETQCITSRVVGTFGYMAPEYAMRGRFSVKLDVFSFGVLVLEIVTGRKNDNSSKEENAEDLLSYTWKHWSKGTILEIVDPYLGDNFSRDEVLRCIQIGLLCVQDVPASRPSMSSVVLMLYSPSMSIQTPLEPILSSGTGTSDSSASTRRSN